MTVVSLVFLGAIWASGAPVQGLQGMRSRWAQMAAPATWAQHLPGERCTAQQRTWAASTCPTG
eukprot:CAMPEP_0206062882 /NCGR_PEP_ID=MMETSP1466-20131121/57947_1 /ASSEMBLY_ACC=CAM_ASM_001126 /TAXON_ID=44452 /ORGANISM="Pavlova gyrans, Strain CCMP608" /LENGTH=62 /DNA_ID=CAMNT_0053438247 /DNA_START=605 /DNA_END=793 /DNA_ORIENTATION=-